MPDEYYQFKELTHQIIGAAMRVHSFLGNGFQEVIYQRALAYELNQANLNFQREQEQYIFYRECTEPIGTRRADFIVENKVLVELKATTKLEEVHKAQILNYLRAYRFEVGLLINFGEKSLFFKRFVMNLDDKADTTTP
ncbi:GxxExxY protein [Roseivirga echinicomitans]|uniref:GxxExxY protein n=1 Tax=Roseivirga echinicomitans TaxID=296218 RepID=A0A150XA31_9BACT|nr:GxxExxY protein [Roseivirga echinicomitans]KYG75522.1 GxxExxY protein [Roseivirga echinicomitans]